MKRDCFDTSGISNPLETMPEDIHESMWNAVTNCIVSGKIAVIVEIYEEMCHIPGKVGDCIRANEKAMVFEIGDPDLSWDWQTYIDHNVRMQEDYHGFISEYTGGSKKTICLNDLTIVALAKTPGCREHGDFDLAGSEAPHSKHLSKRGRPPPTVQRFSENRESQILSWPTTSS